MTRKDREREQARRTERRGWSKLGGDGCVDPPVTHIDDLPEGTPAVVFCRTSSRNGKDQKMEAHSEAVIGMAEQAGLVVAAVVPIQETSKADRLDERKGFLEAANKAKKLNAVLLTATPSRFLRHRDYHPTYNPDVLPTRQDWDELIKHIDVPLAVCHFPKSNSDDVNYLADMGKNHDPTRKKERLRSAARKMHEQGMGYRAIAEQLQERYGVKVSHMTVKRMLRG